MESSRTDDPSAPIELFAGSIALEKKNFQPAFPDSVIGSQPWVSVMCKFSDVSAEPKGLTYFTNMYANSYPGLDHYWREVSYNKVNLAGSTARAGIFCHNRAPYYVYDQDGNGFWISTTTARPTIAPMPPMPISTSQLCRH